MKLGRFLGAFGALVLASGPVLAFQETGQGMVAPVQKPAETTVQPGSVGPAGLDLSTASAAAKMEEGTEVSIPGLGRLGVLPKMDFGLELLYGPSSSPTEPTVTPQDVPLDDLTIRGSVKHNF